MDILEALELKFCWWMFEPWNHLYSFDCGLLIQDNLVVASRQDSSYIDENVDLLQAAHQWHHDEKHQLPDGQDTYSLIVKSQPDEVRLLFVRCECEYAETAGL